MALLAREASGRVVHVSIRGTAEVGAEHASVVLEEEESIARETGLVGLSLIVRGAVCYQGLLAFA